MNGFGALVVLRASSRKALSEDQFEAAPAWTRWLAGWTANDVSGAAGGRSSALPSSSPC